MSTASVIRKLGALIALGAALAPSLGLADGDFALNGHLQPDPVITHTEAPGLAPYVGAALAEWGQTSAIQDGGAGQDVTVTLGDAAGNAAVTQPWVTDGGRMVACEITVSATDWPGWSDAMRESVVAHEIGHCLGLAHSPGGIMCAVNVPDAPCRFDSADREAVAFLYPRAPLLHRATAPMVAGQ